MKKLSFILLLLLLVGASGENRQNTCKTYMGVCTSNPEVVKIPELFGADIVRGYIITNMDPLTIRELPFTISVQGAAMDCDFIVGVNSVKFETRLNGTPTTTLPALLGAGYIVQIYKLNVTYSVEKL